MTELVIGQALDSVMLMSTRRNRGHQKTTYNKNASTPPVRPPSGPISRRNLLIGGVAAVGIAAAGIGVKANADRQRSIQEEQPYQGWQRYQNRALPPELVTQIGENIKGSTYPGFSEVGDLILKSQKDFIFLDQFYPRLKKPISVGMAPLVAQQGALATFEIQTKGVFADVVLRNKATGKENKKLLVDPNEIEFAQVGLDNGIYLGSSTAKKILLVKEFSHLLYMKQLKDIIYNDVTSKNDVTSSGKAPLPEILLATSLVYGDPKKPSGLGYSYDNGNILLDYAGYWHIMPAMGRAMQDGTLTNEDLRVMRSDRNAFNGARKQGLLIEQSRGNFVWKEGIGPFSPEWVNIMNVAF